MADGAALPRKLMALMLDPVQVGMNSRSSVAEAVIVGAGIAGVSAAYHLSVIGGLPNVVVVDELPPLSLTSDKSSECYRNWWPGPGKAMVALMNRSIDLLEDLARQTGNRLQLNRRGYLYATSNPDRIPELEASAMEAANLGAGPLRFHTGRRGEEEYRLSSPWSPASSLTGADLITDRSLIRRHYPYLTEKVVCLLHARRCGWFSAQQLGMLLWEQARAKGVRLQQGRAVCFDRDERGVHGVVLEMEGQQHRIATEKVILAPGPFLKTAASLMDLDLPVYNELHSKMALPDPLGTIPRDSPLLIWSDAQQLPWGEEERLLLGESPETRRLLELLPSGVHVRPEGGDDSKMVLIVWDYHAEPVEPVFPPPFDPMYRDVTLRGLSTMIPGMVPYFERASRPAIDGGYYTRTRENRPLIGPLPVHGAYVIGALSGFGLMAAMAAGELVSAHTLGGALPAYASAFSPRRYEDPEYVRLVGNWQDTGQL